MATPGSGNGVHEPEPGLIAFDQYPAFATVFYPDDIYAPSDPSRLWVTGCAAHFIPLIPVGRYVLTGIGALLACASLGIALGPILDWSFRRLRDRAPAQGI
jgi:hypothetical protein